MAAKTTSQNISKDIHAPAHSHTRSRGYTKQKTVARNVHTHTHTKSYRNEIETRYCGIETRSSGLCKYWVGMRSHGVAWRDSFFI